MSALPQGTSTPLHRAHAGRTPYARGDRRQAELAGSPSASPPGGPSATTLGRNAMSRLLVLVALITASQSCMAWGPLVDLARIVLSPVVASLVFAIIGLVLVIFFQLPRSKKGMTATRFLVLLSLLFVGSYWLAPTQGPRAISIWDRLVFSRETYIFLPLVLIGLLIVVFPIIRVSRAIRQPPDLDTINSFLLQAQLNASAQHDGLLPPSGIEVATTPVHSYSPRGEIESPFRFRLSQAARRNRLFRRAMRGSDNA
jgi:hypothetical protein